MTNIAAKNNITSLSTIIRLSHNKSKYLGSENTYGFELKLTKHNNPFHIVVKTPIFFTQLTSNNLIIISITL